VHDANTLSRIELPPTDARALMEVSMGYTAEVVPEKGIAPDGQHYDAVQRNIRFNHMALLPQGHARAGSGARLRLDGHQEPIMLIRHDDNTSPVQTPKLLVKVDGIDVEKGSDTHLSLLERAIASEKKRADDATAALTVAQTAQGELKAKLDAAEKKLGELDVSKLVQDELDFRSKLLPILPKKDGKPYDFTGKSREQVRADAVGEAVMAEALKLGSDAERAGYLQAHVNMKLASAGRAPTAPLHTPTGKTDGQDPPAKKFRDLRADAYQQSWGGTPAAK
jgi:hypothetical protein